MSDVTKPVTALLEDFERKAMTYAYLHQIGDRGLKGQFPTHIDALDAITFELQGNPMAVFCAYLLGKELGGTQ